MSSGRVCVCRVRWARKFLKYRPKVGRTDIGGSHTALARYRCSTSAGGRSDGGQVYTWQLAYIEGDFIPHKKEKGSWKRAACSRIASSPSRGCSLRRARPSRQYLRHEPPSSLVLLLYLSHRTRCCAMDLQACQWRALQHFLCWHPFCSYQPPWQRGRR